MNNSFCQEQTLYIAFCGTTREDWCGTVGHECIAALALGDNGIGVHNLTTPKLVNINLKYQLKVMPKED